VSDKTIRAAQLVSPFGPGAVVDLGNESFACVDISRWPAGECPTLQDNPLQRALGKGIRRPPTEDQAGQVPFSRFPRWLFCPNCRRLYNYLPTNEEANQFRAPACEGSSCGDASLVPMRFIAVCDQGHLQDVDWFKWAHRNAQVAAGGQCNRQTAKLAFETTGASGGDFNAMAIHCHSCAATNTFEGLTNKPFAFGCLGKQPWEGYREVVGCPALPRVFPRAASNVYYAQTRSALDISHGAEEGAGKLAALQARLVDHPGVAAVRSIQGILPDWEQRTELYIHVVNEAVREFGLGEEETRAAVIAAIKGTGNGGGAGGKCGGDHSQHGFIKAEWPHLSGMRPIQSENLRTRPIALEGVWPAAFREPFEQVTLIDRLREVRALIGFKRMKPDNTAAEVPSDLGQGLDWLPGIETFGEGIFLKLSETYVAGWERRVTPLLAERTKRLSEACLRWGRDPAATYASPRFIALHTLAHGLVRRLAFDAGYSSTSIRERIYCDHAPLPAAGILLYTSDGDSEGSLGGLVRQGSPKRFLGTIMRALADLSWCSADPVCSEMEAQGIDGMNAAACHACVLVSETSCTFNNSLLDRRLVVGSPNGRIPGLLASLALEAQ
jgi:hypothetical protein